MRLTVKNGSEFPDVYEDLGIDLRELGCLMIDTGSPMGSAVDPSGEYYSPDGKKFWMRGVADAWHVTARYGLLDTVRKRHVDAVLDGIVLPATLTTEGFEVFPSPYADEEYECVVVRVRDSRLTLINEQLSVLPNLNTFVEYKPHITVGYFHKGWYDDNKDTLDCMDEVPVLGWNYGHILTKD